MSRPREHSLVLASMALIELAEAREGHGGESDALREVADYLLRLSCVQMVTAGQREKDSS